MGEGAGGGAGISGEIWAEDTTHVKALSWGCLGSLWAGGVQPSQAAGRGHLRGRRAGVVGGESQTFLSPSRSLGARCIRMVLRLRVCGWLQVARV